MSDIEPSKMKVTELRDELKKHGLDTKGKKEQLVKRLEKFLAGEAATQAGDSPFINLSNLNPILLIPTTPDIIFKTPRKQCEIHKCQESPFFDGQPS